jgi:hypothetical protein
MPDSTATDLASLNKYNNGVTYHTEPPTGPKKEDLYAGISNMKGKQAQIPLLDEYKKAMQSKPGQPGFVEDEDDSSWVPIIPLMPPEHLPPKFVATTPIEASKEFKYSPYTNYKKLSAESLYYDVGLKGDTIWSHKGDSKK